MSKNSIYLGCKYLRLSIEDGDKTESESIINQSILIDNYLKKISDITIVDTFKDDGYTGTDFNRPGFKQMVEAATRGEINCIIVKDLSRLGREHIDVDRYVQIIFPKMGIRFISINDNYDSLTANESETHLILPVKSFVNDSYCRDISTKIRSNLAAKRQHGDYVGAFVAYGYMKNPADKTKIIIDKTASDTVRNIFQWRIHGMSNQAISDKLNELGVLAPADHKKTLGVNFKSAFQKGLRSKWSPVAIARILQNPIYIGTLIQGKSYRINYKVKEQRDKSAEDWDIVERNHEAIIDDNMFLLVQDILAKDIRIAPGMGENYLFGGILICGDCGRNLVRRTTTYKGTTSVFYICSTYNKHDGCSRHSIKEEIVFKLVRNALSMYRDMTDGIRRAAAYVRENRVDTEQIVENDKIVIRLQEERVKYSRLLLTLTDNLIKGVIGKSDYELIREKYQRQIEEIEGHIIAQEKYIRDMLEEKFLCDKWLEEYLTAPDLGTIDRNLILRYINQIKVYENNEVTIQFRFQDELEIASRISDSINFIPELQGVN